MAAPDEAADPAAFQAQTELHKFDVHCCNQQFFCD
jgi:hypothetical protein